MERWYFWYELRKGMAILTLLDLGVPGLNDGEAVKVWYRYNEKGERQNWILVEQRLYMLERPDVNIVVKKKTPVCKKDSNL